MPNYVQKVIGALHLFILGVTVVFLQILSVRCTFIDNICTFAFNIGFFKI